MRIGIVLLILVISLSLSGCDSPCSRYYFAYYVPKRFFAGALYSMAAISFEGFMTNTNFSQTAAFIWSVADLLRGDFKQSQYGRVILPFTLLRRLECGLAETKDAVVAKYD